jgi:hypothetical protein
MAPPANPCTYSTYDVAGNMINTGTFNSYSQASLAALRSSGGFAMGSR